MKTSHQALKIIEDKIAKLTVAPDDLSYEGEVFTLEVGFRDVSQWWASISGVYDRPHYAGGYGSLDAAVRALAEILSRW